MQSTNHRLDQTIKEIMRVHAGRPRIELFRIIADAYHEEVQALGLRPRFDGRMVSLRSIAALLGIEKTALQSQGQAAKYYSEARRRVRNGGCTPNQKAKRWVVESPKAKIVLR